MKDRIRDIKLEEELDFRVYSGVDFRINFSSESERSFCLFHSKDEKCNCDKVVFKIKGSGKTRRVAKKCMIYCRVDCPDDVHCPLDDDLGCFIDD